MDERPEMRNVVNYIKTWTISGIPQGVIVALVGIAFFQTLSVLLFMALIFGAAFGLLESQP